MANIALSKAFLNHAFLAARKALPSAGLPCLRTHQTRRWSNVTNTSPGSSSTNDEHLWVRSPLASIEAVRDKTISEFLLERALEWGDAIAYECGVTGRKYSYNEIYRNAKGFAASLVKAGIENNQMVSFVIPNIPEFPIALLGTWEAGCIVSQVNPAYTAEEIQRQWELTGASTVITFESSLDTVIAAKKACPDLKNVIVIGKAPGGCLSFFEMIKTDPTGFEFMKGTDIDMLSSVALMPLSSGTTGPPKGVMLTHSNVATAICQAFQPDVSTLKSLAEGRQERMIGLVPFFHPFGMHCIIQCARQGAHMLTLPRFSPELFVKSIKTHRPTSLQLVTPLLNLISQSSDITPQNLSEIHSIIVGAAPLGPPLVNKFLEKAGRYIFFQEIWGMTECTLCTVIRESIGNRKIGSCGTPLSSTILKVVDPITGATLGPNQPGEILARGPQVMKGYYKNEKATKEIIDADGWLHSGDIGYYDESQHFYIVDRLKELIKVNGLQVSPSELESILRDHEDVADVAVIGVPNEDSGELPRGYIVLKSGKSPDEAKIHAFLAKKLSRYKQLRGGIEFIDSIPKTPSGKILRRGLLTSYKERCGLAR